MLEPLSPLLKSIGQSAVAVTPSLADPAMAAMLMWVGIGILVLTGLGAMGGLGAGIWSILVAIRQGHKPEGGRYIGARRS